MRHATPLFSSVFPLGNLACLARKTMILLVFFFALPTLFLVMPLPALLPPAHAGQQGQPSQTTQKNAQAPESLSKSGDSSAAPAASSAPSLCAKADRRCLLDRLESLTATIPEENWRDRTWRELAKTLAFDGQATRAVAIIGKIKNPDTQAMTIRGIGMATAERKAQPDERRKIFAALRAEAEKITHKPSHAIALTYIAMGQAFAGDDEAARKTASQMQDPALRHKAFGETAEIEAERGDIAQMKQSLAAIDNDAYREKSSLTLVKILARARLFDDAQALAQTIANPTLQTEGIQFILDRQIPREAVKENMVHQAEEPAP